MVDSTIVLSSVTLLLFDQSARADEAEDRVLAVDVAVGGVVDDVALELHLAADRLDVVVVGDGAGEEEPLAEVGDAGGVADVAVVDDGAVDRARAADDAVVDVVSGVTSVPPARLTMPCSPTTTSMSARKIAESATVTSAWAFVVGVEIDDLFLGPDQRSRAGNVALWSKRREWWSRSYCSDRR